MGFPKHLFVEKVEEDYCCKICLDVVENPLQCSHCESLFCYDCIEELIRTLNKCPNCIKIIQTQKVARLVNNAINRLAINCRNGCGKQIALEYIQHHEYDECEANQIHRECKQRVQVLQKECKGLQDQFTQIKIETEKIRNENASLKEMNFTLKYQIDASKIVNQLDIVNDQENPVKLLRRDQLGILKLHNSTFIGELYNNQANGFGLKVLNNGVKVIGEFQNNLSHGRSS